MASLCPISFFACYLRQRSNQKEFPTVINAIHIAITDIHLGCNWVEFVASVKNYWFYAHWNWPNFMRKLSLSFLTGFQSALFKVLSSSHNNFFFAHSLIHRGKRNETLQ